MEQNKQKNFDQRQAASSYKWLVKNDLLDEIVPDQAEQARLKAAYKAEKAGKHA